MKHCSESQPCPVSPAPAEPDVHAESEIPESIFFTLGESMKDLELLCTTIHVHLGIGASTLTRVCLLPGKRVFIFEIRGMSLSSCVASQFLTALVTSPGRLFSKSDKSSYYGDGEDYRLCHGAEESFYCTGWQGNLPKLLMKANTTVFIRRGGEIRVY